MIKMPKYLRRKILQLISIFLIPHFYIYSSGMSDKVKSFEGITFLDAGGAYLSLAKKYQEESPEFWEYHAEYSRMYTLISPIKNLNIYEEEDFKSAHNRCKDHYEEASFYYRKKAFVCECCDCCVCCDCCLDRKNINYAKAMEMKAKKKDIDLFLILNGCAENEKYDPEQSWEKVKNTKPSYEKYAIAKKSEMIFYLNQTEENLDNVIENWENVIKDELLIESFGGETSIYWIAYESFANRKIVTFKFLKDHLFPKDNHNKITIDFLKKAFIDNYEKDIIVYNETKNKVFKAFAYEAAALYNSGEYFEGFYHLPTQGNLNL